MTGSLNRWHLPSDMRTLQTVKNRMPLERLLDRRGRLSDLTLFVSGGSSLRRLPTSHDDTP